MKVTASLTKKGEKFILQVRADDETESTYVNPDQMTNLSSRSVFMQIEEQ